MNQGHITPQSLHSAGNVSDWDGVVHRKKQRECMYECGNGRYYLQWQVKDNIEEGSW